jgi:hypothetical protein
MRTAEVLTLDCGSGRHGRCTHRNPSEKGFPKRLRDGFKIALCGCDCHVACPLTGQADVSDREWEQACSCPGAQLPRDFYRARRMGDQRLRAAAAAVQAESAGKSRTEIRQLLISELKTGSGPLPSSDNLDFAVDHIARSAEQEAAGRTGTTRTVRVLAGELTDLARTLLGGLKNDVSDPGGREPYYLAPDSPVSGLDVIIDPAAQPAPDALGADERRWAEMGGVVPGEQAQRAAKPVLVPVRLESGTEDHEIEGEWGGALRRTTVAVHLGRHQLGRLSAEDGARLSSDLQAARQQNRAVWMNGYYYAPTTAARARLLLYPGSLPFPSSPGRV